MFERHLGAPLLNADEHLHEDLLGQIFFTDATRQMTAHNADDHGVKPLHQPTSGSFVAMIPHLRRQRG